MRLKHIKLSGFKSFADLTTVPFTQQMTAVVGPNGCGKSNIIDAVRWVLGESSAKNLRGDAMTDVIFNGSSERKPVSQASVELLFENTQGHISGNLADRSEIAIKRIVTREAQSTYYLNGTKCRRRDITDIFLGTGLGPRSYAIIEQGMISRLIESKPQELRVFIEEAAGISKYKERRRDSENRIKRTRENLARLSDIRDELSKNIEKLKRQATSAQRYKELKTQERKLKAELTSIKWLSYNTRLQQLEQQLSQQSTELEKYHADQTGEQRQLVNLKQQALQARQQFEQVQARFYQLGSVITRLEQQILQQHQQQQHLSQQLLQAEQSVQQSSEFIASEQLQHQQVTEQIDHAEPEIAMLDAQLEQLEQQLASLELQQVSQQQAYQQWQQQQFELQKQQQQIRLQLQGQQQQQLQLNHQQQQLEQDMAQLEIAPLAAKCLQHKQQLAIAEQQQLQQQLQVDVHQQNMQQQTQQLEHAKLQFQRETTLLHSLELEQQRLNQRQQQQDIQQQQLLRQLEVKPGWALAVTMALGQLQHANALTEQTTVLNAENTQTSFVCQASAGTVVAAATKQQRLSSVIMSGIYPQSFENIILVENAADAYALQASLSMGQSIISADGVWLGANWGLYASAEQDNYLQITEQLVALKPRLHAAKQALQCAEVNTIEQQQQFDQLMASLGQQQQQLMAAQQQVQQQKTALLLAEQALQHAQKQQVKLSSDSASMALNQAILVEKIAEHHVKLELCEQQLVNHEQQQQQLTEQQQHFQQQLIQHRAYFEQKRQQQQQLVLQYKMSQQQQQTLALSLQRAKQQQRQLLERVTEFKLKLQQDDEPELLLQQQLQQALLELEQAEKSMHQQQDQVSELEQHMRQLEQGQHSIEQILHSKRVAQETLRIEAEGYRVRANNMLEQLGQQQANIAEVLADLVPNANEQHWQRQLELTTESIQRLGAINLAAIDEYEQQAERKHYLDAQNDDLEAAIETLETAIRKIDKETRQKFKQTFDQVNEGLKNLFPKVFGGGSAYLALTEDDLLETGVSIMARPPGKKNSTIHLLSGGEKALIALSLVFSIFRLNPAPFCMLDEVDAPLDDANVGRFCNLVREMSETVQFIYISHNKIAMEMATQLMGVTMQEPGVSRVVAVDVDDAVKMTAAS